MIVRTERRIHPQVDANGLRKAPKSAYVVPYLQRDRKPIFRAGRKRKEGNGQRPLLRPIICICNDLYASSLAKLRPLARIIRFSRPADIHIVKRLREICERPGFARRDVIYIRRLFYTMFILE